MIFSRVVKLPGTSISRLFLNSEVNATEIHPLFAAWVLVAHLVTPRSEAPPADLVAHPLVLRVDPGQGPVPLARVRALLIQIRAGNNGVTFNANRRKVMMLDFLISASVLESSLSMVEPIPEPLSRAAMSNRSEGSPGTVWSISPT